MKLSEALLLRSEVQKRIQLLANRLELSARIQEGNEPPEDPGALLEELERALAEFQNLVTRINVTNTRATLASGESITAALARRDTLSLRHHILQAFAKSASQGAERFTHTEIRIIPTTDVRALRQQLDATARERRDLDIAIQTANWSTELIE